MTKATKIRNKVILSVIAVMMFLITIAGATAVEQYPDSNPYNARLIYHLNESSFGDATDSLYGAVLTESGTTNSNNGVYGKSANFSDGSYMKSAVAISVAGWSNITFCEWVNPNACINGGVRGTLYYDDNNYLGFSSNGVTCQQWRSYNVIASTSCDALATTDYPVNISKWQHACITLDGSNIKLYLNGYEVKSSACTKKITDFAGSPKIYLGDTDDPDAGYTENGAYDEVIIFNYTLTSSQILQLALGNVSGTSPTPTYDFLNISNINITDKTNFTTNEIVSKIFMNNTYTSNCSLYINSTLNETKTGYTAGTNINVNFTKYMSDGDYTEYIYCVQGNDSTYNQTSNGINFTIDYYRDVTFRNEWNLSNITTGINITCNGTNYATLSGGKILVPREDIANCTTYAPNHISRTLDVNFTSRNNPTIDIWQSVTTLWSKEINLATLINRWNLSIDGRNKSTETANITIRPNLGVYLVNWTTNFGYFNVTGNQISLTIDDTSENLSMTGFWARNITFRNSLGLETISPTCTQDGYTYTPSYYMPNSTTDMVCSLTGYQNTTFTSTSLQATPDSSVYNMTPAELWLIFTEIITGYIETSDCNESPDNCEWFNNTAVLVPQYNLSLGRVMVKFNNDGSDNWQQIYEFTNDNNTHIKEYIQIITPDLVQQLKITGEGNPLADARVCSKTLGTNPDTNDTDWLTTYCTYTNVDGYATILLADSNTYKFCIQKEGYDTTCEIHFIPPANTEALIIDIDAEESTGGHILIFTTCGVSYTENSVCTLEINTYRPYNTICLNFSSPSLNTTSCSSDSVSKTYSYNLYNVSGITNIEIYLDGILERNITHEWYNTNYTIDVSWEGGVHSSGDTLMEKIKGDRIFTIVAYVLLIILGVVMGFMAEKYFNGYGIYGSALWFAVLGGSGLYLFWVPVIVIGIWAIVKHLSPLIKN